MGKEEVQTSKTKQTQSTDVVESDLKERAKTLLYVDARNKTLGLDDRSRMRRESHVRFCEREGGRFPLPTRLA